MNKPLILVVEDDPSVRNLITTTLKTNDYRYVVAPSGSTAIMEVTSHNPEIILLDLGLPDMDGVQVIQTVRSWSNTPIIVISARSEDNDKIHALDAGADDYLTKPFAMKEFLARVRAMTRRKTVYAARKLKFGDFSLDSENFELACENSMRLSVKEFELLQTLVLNSDHEVDTDYLLEHVWEGVDNADGETVWVYISYLRGKLKSIASNVLIEGERDGNYRLVTEG